MKKVYVDECGYTGEDLLNPDQPFQAVASVVISEDEARKLIDRHFPRKKSSELKHKQLAKRPGYWRALGDIQEELFQRFTCHCYVVDKRFMLLQKFIGNCIEPFYHSVGIDFYESGQSQSAASLLHRCGPILFGEELFESFLRLYQKTVREKQEEDISALVDMAEVLMKENLAELFGPLGSGFAQATEELKTEGVSLDLAYPLVIGLVNLVELGGSAYKIVHDQSENLKQYARSFQSMIDVEEVQSFKFSQVSRLDFPLHLQEVTQVDSKDSPAVQLADLLAGGIVATSQALMTQPERKNYYTERLQEIYKGAPERAIIFQIPSLDFDNTVQMMQRNDSQRFIEFSVKNLE